MIHDRDGSKRTRETFALHSTSSFEDNATATSRQVAPNYATSSELKKGAGLVAAAAHAAVPTWANMALMVSLIFGGCCANVSMMVQYVEGKFWEQLADIGRRYLHSRPSSSRSTPRTTRQDVHEANISLAESKPRLVSNSECPNSSTDPVPTIQRK